MRREKCLRLVILTAACVFAACGFAVRAAQAKKCADGAWHNVTIYLETPLSEEGAQALLSQESAAGESETAFAAWGELEGQTVTDPDLGRSTAADVLVCCGMPELVFAQTGLSEDDDAGCLIGEETAWELFGSTRVAGDEICIGNGTWTIRAVTHQPKRGIVVAGSVKDIAEGSGGSAGGGDAAPYNRITIESRDAAEGEAFLVRHALDGKLLRLDYLRNMSWLFELVPGKWSDFYGWKENCKEKKEDFLLLARVQKNSVELYYEEQCRLSAHNAALSAVCVLIAVTALFAAAGGLKE